MRQQDGCARPVALGDDPDPPERRVVGGEDPEAFTDAALVWVVIPNRARA